MMTSDTGPGLLTAFSPLLSPLCWHEPSIEIPPPPVQGDGKTGGEIDNILVLVGIVP